MKRLSLVLIVGVIFAAAVVAQNTGRQEDAGSFFMQTSDAGSQFVPASINAVPNMAADGAAGLPMFFQPVAQNLQSTILVEGLATPEPHQ